MLAPGEDLLALGSALSRAVGSTVDVVSLEDPGFPLLEELNGTLKRLRGTADFVTEEAVKPIITVAGTYAKMRATMKTVVGKNGKRR